MTPEDQERRQQILPVIKTYLIEKFPECEISDHPFEPGDHLFQLADVKNRPYKSYFLRVQRPLLEDRNSTPDWIKASLYSQDIAGEVRAALGKPQGFYWQQPTFISELGKKPDTING